MVMTGAAALRAVATAACCLGLAACSSRPALMTAPASPATPDGTPTPYRTPTPATTSAVARPSHTPVCRTSQLKIRVLRGLAAGGTAGGYLGFTSHARKPCILHGWPAVADITAAGESSTAIRRTTTMFGPTVPNVVPVVTIKPGALAVAVFTVADGGPPYCPPPYRLLRVTPPGNRPVVISAWLHPYVRGYLPACTRIFISALVPASYVDKP